MAFKKAERKAVKLKLALAGISGSGKTMGAILLARGLVGPQGRIALIDTENGRAKLYENHHMTAGISFDVAELYPPYTVDKYINEIQDAVKNGYDVLIIDSISHAWDGSGGILDQKNMVDSRGGNSFTNWAKFTPQHNKFIAEIINCNCHVICTMRSKSDVSIQQNDKGKSVPVKVGMKVIQREGIEYEFDTIFEIAHDHTFSVSKDRTGLFDGTIDKISEQIGETLAQWLSTGKTPEKAYSALLQHYKNDDKLSALDIVKSLSSNEKKSIATMCDAEMLDWIKVVSLAQNV